MSWDWLFFWREKPALPIHRPPVVIDDNEQKLVEEVEESLNPYEPPQLGSMRNVFLEAIQETQEEQVKLESELLNDNKLREYVKNVIKATAKKLLEDKHNFILIHPHEVKLSNDKLWPLFAKIMVKLFKEIDINAQIADTYLDLDKKEVREAFSKMKRQSIDIDERTRAMLSQGIYR